MLVAIISHRYLKLRKEMYHLQHLQISMTAPSPSASVSTHTTMSLVSHCHRFHHQSPKSQGNTTILTVIDRFSKACQLIPLPKLPTAFDTAQVLCDFIFRFYGLPDDIFSEKGSDRVHLPSLVYLLQATQCKRESHLRLSASVQWPNWTPKSSIHLFSTFLLSIQSIWME